MFNKKTIKNLLLLLCTFSFLTACVTISPPESSEDTVLIIPIYKLNETTRSSFVSVKTNAPAAEV